MDHERHRLGCCSEPTERLDEPVEAHTRLVGELVAEREKATGTARGVVRIHQPTAQSAEGGHIGGDWTSMADRPFHCRGGDQVAHDRSTLHENDVAGVQAAMGEADPVRSCDRAAHLDVECDRIGHEHRAEAEPIREAAVVAECLHHLDVDIVDLHDVSDHGEVRMAECGDGLGVGAQPITGRTVGDCQPSDGNGLAAESVAAPPMHGAVGPAPELQVEPVGGHDPPLRSDEVIGK